MVLLCQFSDVSYSYLLFSFLRTWKHLIACENCELQIAWELGVAVMRGRERQVKRTSLVLFIPLTFVWAAYNGLQEIKLCVLLIILIKAGCSAGRLGWFFCSPSSAGLSCGHEEGIVILCAGFSCRTFQGQRPLPLLCLHIPTDCSMMWNSLLIQNFFSTFKMSMSDDREIHWHGGCSWTFFSTKIVFWRSIAWGNMETVVFILKVWGGG